MSHSRGASRAVRVGLVALAIIGCGPVRTATGPCELQVFVDAHQQIEELALPYVVELGADPMSITFGGSGWQRVEIVAVRPDGNVDDIYTGDGSMINQTGFVAFPVGIPGTWRFRVSDTLAGWCSGLQCRGSASHVAESRSPPDRPEGLVARNRGEPARIRTENLVIKSWSQPRTDWLSERTPSPIPSIPYP